MKTHDLLNWKSFMTEIGLEKEYEEGVKKHGNSYENNDIFSIHPVSGYLSDISWAMEEQYKDANWAKFWWVLMDHNSSSYSKEKSKQIVLEAIKKLAKSYDTIPLVYTTLPLPSYVNFGSSIWREIQGINSFNKEDYGHIDIVSAIRELVKEEIIEVIFFKLLDVHNNVLTFKVEVMLRRDKGITLATLEASDTSKKQTIPQKNGFREDNGLILFDNQRLNLQPQQRKLLVHFLQNPDRCIPYATLQELAIINKRVDLGNLQKIINKIRQEVQEKTGKDLFKTVSNTGYIFELKKLR